MLKQTCRPLRIRLANVRACEVLTIAGAAARPVKVCDIEAGVGFLDHFNALVWRVHDPKHNPILGVAVARDPRAVLPQGVTISSLRAAGCVARWGPCSCGRAFSCHVIPCAITIAPRCPTISRRTSCSRAFKARCRVVSAAADALRLRRWRRSFIMAFRIYAWLVTEDPP